MTDTAKYINSFRKLHKYCAEQEYRGWCLLDSHNSFIPFSRLGAFPSFLINQFNRRSPLNFRKLMGVKKGINPKAFGLFLSAYSKMNAFAESIGVESTESISNNFFDWLSTNHSKGYNGHCWGYNYDWPQRNGNIVPAYTPSSVVTGFNVRAIFDYYQEFKNERAKNIIHSAASFVLNDLFLSKTKYGLCFSYTPIYRDLVINASLLAGEVLAYDDYLHNSDKHNETLVGLLDFAANLQNKDGSWDYSYQIDTFHPRKQIDFHQGYILESMSLITQYANIRNDVYDDAIKNGLNYYFHKQFSKDGISYWRLPKKWPIDIHNQSQGIITFAKFALHNRDYLPFAGKIADWTILNMQSKKGYFYYQKWPFITNKISYIRWSQAWMLVALLELHVALSKI